MNPQAAVELVQLVRVCEKDELIVRRYLWSKSMVVLARNIGWRLNERNVLTNLQVTPYDVFTRDYGE